jgi:hypothetical protein
MAPRLCVLFLATQVTAQAPIPSGETGPISPSVVGTTVFYGQEFELLVLWRDQPGWFLRRDTSIQGKPRGVPGLTGGQRDISPGEEATFGTAIEYGGVKHRLAYNRETRVARIGDVQVLLSEGKNVILADEVAHPAGKVKVTVTAVDPVSNALNQPIASIISGSAEVVAFLRCEAGLPDKESPESLRRSLSRTCDDLQSGKGR